MYRGTLRKNVVKWQAMRRTNDAITRQEDKEMSETSGVYNVGERLSRPQPPPSFERQLGNLPPAVRSVAESLALRDMEGAKRYVALYLSGNRGVR